MSSKQIQRKTRHPNIANMSYFPTHNLRRTQLYSSRTPVVLVACGFFNPITFPHLKMFDLAREFAETKTEFEIMGGYFAPVGNAYVKPGLATAQQRLRMCQLAVESSDWLMVDSWEVPKRFYISTSRVLDHFDHQINSVLGGVKRQDGTNVRVQIMLLAGADLFQIMDIPRLWKADERDNIFGKYGSFIVEHQGTDIDTYLSTSLNKYRNNIYVVKQDVQKDFSTTKVRLFLRKELSVDHMVPKAVIDHIERNGLYMTSEHLPEGNTKGNSKSKSRQQVAEGIWAMSTKAGLIA